jgi:hypothetical protein
VPAPTAAPTAAPATAAPEPIAAPTLPPATAEPEPTAAPAADDVLPAPLYFTGNPAGQINQIWRLERDGKTRTMLIEEPPASGMLTIVEMDVSPADGALAYLVQGQSGYTLVRADADGKNRKELLPAGSISQIRWSPDGKTIAFAMYRAPGETTGLAGGVYLLPALGGEPKLLQANDEIKDPSNPPLEARGYSPQAWSPDGEALLLNAFSQAVELCDVAVKYVSTGDLVVMEPPEGLHTRCGSGVWSQDSLTVYVGMSRPGYLAPVPGLWRATPTNGRTAPHIPAEPTPGMFNLVEAPLPLKDGSLNVFVATTDKLEEPGENPSQTPPQYRMEQISVDAVHATELRGEIFSNIENRVLWARDGSGIVMEYTSDITTVLWVPANNDMGIDLGADLSINSMRWGP